MSPDLRSFIDNYVSTLCNAVNNDGNLPTEIGPDIRFNVLMYKRRARELFDNLNSADDALVLESACKLWFCRNGGGRLEWLNEELGLVPNWCQIINGISPQSTNLTQLLLIGENTEHDETKTKIITFGRYLREYVDIVNNENLQLFIDNDINMITWLEHQHPDFEVARNPIAAIRELIFYLRMDNGAQIPLYNGCMKGALDYIGKAENNYGDQGIYDGGLEANVNSIYSCLNERGRINNFQYENACVSSYYILDQFFNIIHKAYRSPHNNRRLKIDDEFLGLIDDPNARALYNNLRGYIIEQSQEKYADKIEQQELDELYHNKNSETILNWILDNQDVPGDPMEEVNGRRYKRANKIIAAIKKIRGFECQICGWNMGQQNDRGYIEAAHIKPKYEGGAENLNNIILLCPNHHKEYDFGRSAHDEPIEDSIGFSIGDQRYIMYFETHQNETCRVECDNH